MHTMSNKAVLAITAMAAVLATGCSTTRTFVDYSRGALYSTETVGNVPFVEVGPASASQRGFFWNSCWEMAEKAVAKLRASAEQYGANNVSAVRWLNYADGTYTETPICTTGWGWFSAALVGGFMPWVKVTEVKGHLVFADETQLARYRTEVAKRSSMWRKAEGERLALESMSDEQKAVKAAADKVASEKLVAEKAAADKAAADKAAADKAAADKAIADFEAAQKAAAARPPPKKAAKPATTSGSR